MKNSKGLNKAGKIISKICEVFHWVGAVIALVSAAVCFIAPNSASGKVFIDGLNGGAPCYGMNVEFATINGATAGATFVVAAVMVSIMAMVFRNANLCLKLADGETKHAKGATPFQPDVQRMIREMGIFMIASFVVALIGTIIISAVAAGTGCSIETSTNFEMVIFGILMLCLSQMFTRGIELESEVEGLI